jgi:hypothetical protein
MVKKIGKAVKISGGAVSLYLTADVKHLHDLARQHPHLTCSEIYATALRSALGEAEEKHPLEMMMDNQKREVEEIQAQLDSATKRLEATEGKLPLELAKAEWMRNLLGQEGLTRLKALRRYLFFDATSWSGLNAPKSGREGLVEYKELLTKYEQTKRGPTIGGIQIIDNLHPSHLFKPEDHSSWEGVVPICCEVERGVCGIQQWEATPTYVGRDVYVENSEGTNLCDDLQFRCPIHTRKRQYAYQGKEINSHNVTVTCPKLKPHWEEEEMTPEQVALAERGQHFQMSNNSGYLQQEELNMAASRSKKIISWAISEWQLKNPGAYSQLTQLTNERSTTARDENNRHLPTWAGMPAIRKGDKKFRISSATATRRGLINQMSEAERAAYQECLKSYETLLLSRGEYISGLVSEWRAGGQQWPYEPMENWDDSGSILDLMCVNLGDSKFFTEEILSVSQTIDNDLRNFAYEKTSSSS